MNIRDFSLQRFSCMLSVLMAMPCLLADSKGAANSDIEAKIANAEECVWRHQVRAIELSLYYQGFSPNIIGTFDPYAAYNKFFNNLPQDEDLKRPIEMRNAKRAFLFAQKAYESNEYVTYASSNLANLFLQGIGCKKDIPKAKELLAESGYFASEIKISTWPPDDLAGPYRFDSFKYYTPLIAYMYHYGIGVEKDEAKCEIILNEALGAYAWRNFYSGFMVPKDFDFAIHCLERRKEFWAAEILAKIYSGEYLPEHADKEKAAYWNEIAKERMHGFAEEQKQYYKEEIRRRQSYRSSPYSIAKLSIYFGFKKAYISSKWKYENVLFENPFYDLEKAISLLNELDKEYVNKPETWKDIAKDLNGVINPEPFWPRTVKYENGPIFDRLKELYEKYKKLAAKDQAKDDYLKALEQSLYYQGWAPGKVFNQLDGILDNTGHSNYDEIPHNSELVGQIQIKDAAQSFEWAKKAYELRKHNHLCVANLVKHYISGIGTTPDYDKALNLLINYNSSLKELQNKPSEKIEQRRDEIRSNHFTAILACMYQNGLGVQQDLIKSKALIGLGDFLSWKNFYIGKFAPYDRNFAISLLKEDDNKILSAYFLYLIYSGKLNSEDKNLEEAKHWKDLYDKGMNSYKHDLLQSWDEEIVNLKAQAETTTPEGRKAMRLLAFMYLIKHKYRGIHFNKRIFTENPNYNPTLAKKLIKDSGFSDLQLYWVMIGILGRDEDGDIDDMKKYVKEALECDTLTNEQKEAMSTRAEELEKRRRNYYEVPPFIDNLEK